MNNRYFIVAYLYTLIGGAFGTGDMTLYTEGSYPARHVLLDAVKDSLKNYGEMKHISILNVMEVSRADFEDFAHKK